jgi:hypothetical protein
MNAIIVIVIIAAVIVLAALYLAMRSRRTDRLQDRFGPEYDRTVEETGGRRAAESELAAREKRREELDIRELSPASRDRYRDQWSDVQARFVDDPSAAVGQADSLVIYVMRDRGYPVDDFDQRVADISVDHADVADNYRAARDIARANEQGTASTEDLRQAMVHYRTLFEELLGTPAGATQDTGATQNTGATR